MVIRIRRLIRAISLPLIMTFLAAIAHAQEGAPPAKSDKPIELSLKKAIEMSLENNRDIDISRYQPMLNDASVTSILGAYDVTLSASVSGGENVYQSPSLFGGGAVIDEDSFATSLGLGQLLPFGMKYSANLKNSRTLTSSTAMSPNPRWNQSLGVTITLPILKGFGTASQYDATVVVARNNREISIDEFENVLTVTIFNVQKAYWELVWAIKNKEVKEQSLAVAKRFLEETQERLKVGRATRIDVIQAEAGVAIQEESVITAENAVRDAEDALKILIDPSLVSRKLDDANIVLTDELAAVAKPFDANAEAEASFTAALQMRPDYRQKGRQIENQGLKIRKLENDLLPKLDVTGGATLQGLNDNPGTANGDMFSRDYRELTAGLTLEFPLGNNAAKGERLRGDLENRILLLERKKIEDKILVEVRDAVRDIKTAERRIEATKKAEELAKAQFDAEKERKEQGVSTWFAVLDTQKEYTNARTNAIRSLIDYNIALFNLQRVCGTLLEKNNVLIRENLTPKGQ